MNSSRYLLLLLSVLSISIGVSSLKIQFDDVVGNTGSNDTTLRCVFKKSEGEAVQSVVLFARIVSTGEFSQIALFLPNQDGILLMTGQYLSGRVKLSNLTQLSTDVTLRFMDLQCDDETSFGCKVLFSSTAGVAEKEKIINLMIAVKPSVPNIVWDEFSVSEGDNVTFTCFGSIGKPPGSFSWQKRQENAKPCSYKNVSTESTIVEDSCFYNGTSNLTIPVTDYDNNAVIRCSVNNSNDEVYYNETRALNVMYKVRKPSITRQPMNDEYIQGSGQIILTCTVRGNPHPSYKWFKDGNMDKILNSSDTLYITEVITNNSGVYRCNVTNNVSGLEHTESTSLNIMIVSDTPEISMTTTVTTQKQDESESAEVVSSLQIQFDDVVGNIGSNDTTLRCAFKKSEGEAVQYVVLCARNVYTSEFNQIALFLPNQDGILVTTGQYLSGRVTLSNLTPLSTDVTLRFKDLQCDVETSFGCKILSTSTTGVTENEKFINLTVAVNPSVPNIVWNEFSVFEGDNVTFTCIGSIGKPPGSFSWQKRQENATLSSYKNVSTQSTIVDDSCYYNGTSNLTIQVTDYDNNAVIRCSVNNSNDEVYYNETQALNVIYKVRKPSITRQPMNDEYLEGSGQIILTCTGRGNPHPSYKWFKDENMDEILNSSDTLYITDVITHNSGVYRCNVTNNVSGLEHTESTAVNIMIVVSSLHIQFDDVVGNIGSTNTTLRCAFDKSEGETVQSVVLLARNVSTGEYSQIALFLPNQEGILVTTGQYLSSRVTLSNLTPMSTDVTLRFKDLQCDDETSFGCKILSTSTAGVTRKEKSINLTVSANPSVPNIVMDEFPVLEGDNVTFTCIGSIGKPPGSFSWQKRQQNAELSSYRNVSTKSTLVEDSCFYNGTSTLTIQVTDYDNNAVIRCSVNNSNDEVYYNETRALNVILSEKPDISMTTIVTIQTQDETGCAEGIAFGVIAAPLRIALTTVVIVFWKLRYG